MSRRAILSLCGLLVLAYGLVAIGWPEQTLSPGDVLPGHTDLAGDCLRCHLLFLGTPNAKCLACHPLEEIDTRRAEPGREPGFPRVLHTLLADADCGVCHSEHAATLSRRPPVRFAHTALEADARDRCGACHEGPRDSLHASVDERCGACHGTQAWTPATYDHDRYFRFDRAHPPDCDSCHPGGDLKQYTCYGCHAHTPRGMAREHREEGIRDFEACAECHRSGDEHEIEGFRGRRDRAERGERRRVRRERRHDDDDDDDD